MLYLYSSCGYAQLLYQWQHKSCFGARMTGGGFGGCAVALVDLAQVNEFIAHVEADYTAQNLTNQQFMFVKCRMGRRWFDLCNS